MFFIDISKQTEKRYAPEKLMRYHFETLFLHERAKIDHMKT